MRIFELIIIIILITIQILWLIYIKDITSMFKSRELDMDDPHDYLHVLFCRIGGVLFLIYFIKLFIEILFMG